MHNEIKKIGKLIAQVRQDRGLSQSEFAKLLHTSQSAINRIEHGNQNLSLETLARISDVLNKQLINISSAEISLRVEGGRELSGAISVKKSKNAAVALLCAALLNKGTTKLKNIPKIEEVSRIIEVISSVGASVKWVNGTDIEIKTPVKLNMLSINKEAAKKTRSVIMLIGPLMHEMKAFDIPFAGGCELGKRTVLPHLYALEELGVNVQTKNGVYKVTSKKRPSKRPIVLFESGDTTTENILMAASRIEQETVIKMASANYMVQDLCLFLKKLGVKIEGIGTSTLTVKGVANINKNVAFSPSEDPVEAMTFIAAAIATNSKITIQRAPIEFLELELLKLEKMGLSYSLSNIYLAENEFTKLADITIHKHNSKLIASEEKIYARPFPGLNIDHLPYFVPISAVAKGRTLIHDWVFEDRALMYTEMKKVGVDIQLADPHRAFINGPTKWRSADVVCPPGIRPAVIILIGMLAAPGISVLRNVYTINRGYEELANRLNELGARIAIERDI